MVRWRETSELEPHFFSDLHPAEEPGRYLPLSLIRWHRMDRRSAFRAFVLLACVIICSDVLCPVGAYLYNNRYAGWVKPPIHLWGSWMLNRLLRSHSVGGAHWEVLCRDVCTRRRALSYTRSKSLKSLRSSVHPYCFGKCLRHNMQFSVPPRPIQLTDGIWDKRQAFRWLVIGTDDSLQQSWSVSLLSVMKIQKIWAITHVCGPAHLSLCVWVWMWSSHLST